LLDQQQVELAMLARFMQILPDWFCEAYRGRLINIHYSFLPALIGANPYRQAHERGVIPFAKSPCAYPYRRRLLTAAVLIRSFLGS
jgi:hypothetical protein